jgi:biotin transport system ATP-binding protein
VALASVLVMAPRVLLLDEPAASLDRRGRALLRRALEGFGGALVWADHSLPAGFEGFFDRQWLLADGRLVEEK